jgi:hypothetical protein
VRPYEAYQLMLQKQANMLTHGLWKGTALGAVPGALAGGADSYAAHMVARHVVDSALKHASLSRLNMQKLAASAPLTFAQGLWKGTVAGAVPGAAIGAYKGYENNPENRLSGALTGAAVGGFIGGAAGRGAQYGSRIYRVGKELDKAKALNPAMKEHKLLGSRFGSYLAGGMVEREVAQSAGKGGFSAAAREYAQSGKAVKDIDHAVEGLHGSAVSSKPPVANYGKDAAALASTTAGSALMGGVAEGAFGDKRKSFGERFAEGAGHGALGGLVVGGPNLALKHWSRRNAGSNHIAGAMNNLYSSKLYKDHEGSIPNSFIAGGKKGLAIGLGMDTITGYGSPEKSAYDMYMHAVKEATNKGQFLNGYWKGLTAGGATGAAAGALYEHRSAKEEHRAPEYAKTMLKGTVLGAATGGMAQAAIRNPWLAIDVATSAI